MANDWTIGVEITDIIDVAAGDADNNEAMVMITTKAAVWSGTDITTFATLSSTAGPQGGNFTTAAYIGAGKFIVATDNGKLYSLYFSTASSAPVITLIHTDESATPVSATAYAASRDEVVFACENKIYTIPAIGGSATERMDSESVVVAGSKVTDVDHSSKGWAMIVQKPDYSVATVIATEDWSSIVTGGFSDDISVSPIYEVNYYEGIANGTWMAGRGDGNVVSTTDLDSWRSITRTELVGSYGRAVANSLGPGDGLTYSDYNKRDFDKTIEALLATGQTMYGFAADDGDNDFWWPQFLDLLEKTIGTGLNIFAVVRDRHLYTGANRWGVVGGEPGNVQRSTDTDSAVGWIAAATELSALSATYPHLIGFVIDDFGPVQDPYHGGYSMAEVSAITSAAKSSNSDFKFWPTQYFSAMLKQVVPSVVIGITQNMPMSLDEYVATEYSFDVVNAPSTAILSFLMSDGNTRDDYDGLQKNIYVNGSSIYSADSVGFQFVEIIDADIAAHLSVGSNTIRVEVKATKDLLMNNRQWQDKLLYVETPSLVLDGATEPTLTQTFDRLPLYAGEGLGYGGSVMTRSPQNTYPTSVDGFFAVYSNNSVYDSIQPTLAQKYKAAIGDKELNYVDQAFLYGKGISSTSIVNKMSAVSSIATSTLAWNYPFDLYDQDVGVFSQKTPVSANEWGSMLCIWPEKYASIEGWSQTWTTIAQYSGVVEIKIRDSQTSDGVHFQKKISTTTDPELYIDSTAGNEVHPQSASYAEVLTPNLGSAPVNVSFEISAIGGVGDVHLKTEFGIQIDGAWLSPEDFTFASSTDNAGITDTFQNIATYFLKPSWER